MARTTFPVLGMRNRQRFAWTYGYSSPCCSSYSYMAVFITRMMTIVATQATRTSPSKNSKHNILEGVPLPVLRQNWNLAIPFHFTSLPTNAKITAEWRLRKISNTGFA